MAADKVRRILHLRAVMRGAWRLSLFGLQPDAPLDELDAGSLKRGLEHGKA